MSNEQTIEKILEHLMSIADKLDSLDYRMDSLEARMDCFERSPPNSDSELPSEG